MRRLRTTPKEGIRRDAPAPQKMNTAVSLVHTGITKQQRDEYTTKLIETFYVAQSAWDAYRAHLREHGILPVIPPATHV